jgi:predicted transcriptional regulator
MNKVKEEAISLIDRLPEETTWDDIIHQIYVKKKIEEGIKAAEQGRKVFHDEVWEIIDKVIEQLTTLPDNSQKQVLEFVRTLKSSVPQGVPGRQLLRFAGTIGLDDLKLMVQAIKTGCEQPDMNEW